MGGEAPWPRAPQGTPSAATAGTHRGRIPSTDSPWPGQRGSRRQSPTWPRPRTFATTRRCDSRAHSAAVTFGSYVAPSGSGVHQMSGQLERTSASVAAAPTTTATRRRSSRRARPPVAHWRLIQASQSRSRENAPRPSPQRPGRSHSDTDPDNLSRRSATSGTCGEGGEVVRPPRHRADPLLRFLDTPS